MVCGTNATSTTTHGVAIRKNSVINGTEGIAIGSSNITPGSNVTKATGNQSIAIGTNVESKGASSIAVGGNDLNEASSVNIDGSKPSKSINGGTLNDVFKSYTNINMVEPGAFGITTKAAGAASVAVGVKAVSDGALSTAVGTKASSSGIASSATKDGSIAISAGSVTGGNATSQTSMTVGGVSYKVAGNVLDDKSVVKDGAQMSVGSIGSERQIKNIASGEISATSTDAVNGSQLFATNSAVNMNVDRINSLGNRVNDLGYRIDDIKDNANAGISSAMAIASLPQPYLPGKSMISGALGTYNNEGAMAIGISSITNDGRWVIKAGSTFDTQKNWGGSVGAGYQF